VNRSRLAQLLREGARVAAELAELLEEDVGEPANDRPAPPPRKKSPRRRRRSAVASTLGEVSELDRARARAACRKFGIRMDGD
jgi:hypothetical protein